MFLGGVLLDIRRRVADLYVEHHHFGRHCWHFIPEAECVGSVNVRGEGVLSVWFPLTRVNWLRIRPRDFHIHVQETAFGHFKGQTQLMKSFTIESGKDIVLKIIYKGSIIAAAHFCVQPLLCSWNGKIKSYSWLVWNQAFVPEVTFSWKHSSLWASISTK